jgi:hypothetical protein
MCRAKRLYYGFFGTTNKTEIRNSRRRIDDKIKVDLKSGVRMWTGFLANTAKNIKLRKS